MSTSYRPSHTRSRSRSPRRNHESSHRDRSPHSHSRHHHSRRSEPNTSEAPTAPVTLPFNSRQLTKRDLDVFKPIFALYLDIQKGKIMEDMDDTEVKGRWKSFLGKWNRGELSEGWYDPSTLQKAISAEAASTSTVAQRDAKQDSKKIKQKEREQSYEQPRPSSSRGQEIAPREEDTDSEDSIGPSLPGQEPKSRKSGPTIPGLQDLSLKREQAIEDHHTHLSSLRDARKLDRQIQKAQLEDLIPRAEAGTRERQLEKKKEVGEKMRAFREGSTGPGEVGDSELMGDGGLEGFKKEKREFEMKKNEREVRREENLRARAAEREERLGEYREKEEGTMRMLRALAKQRFG